jgi:phosphopantothenoylcysteine synthetase/decarboxylase
LNEELGSNHYDAVIHAAAVGDYSLESIESQGKILANGKGKLESTGDTLTICLKKNPKLVDGLRAISKNPKIQIVAFKLTNTSDPTERQDAIASLAKHARPDFIVHNDLSEITERQHITRIFSVDQPGQLHEIAKAPTKNQTAEVLGRLLEKSGVEL